MEIEKDSIFGLREEKKIEFLRSVRIWRGHRCIEGLSSSSLSIEFLLAALDLRGGRERENEFVKEVGFNK